MNFDIPQDMQDYLDELDQFIENTIKPLENENDNIRFFDHRREDRLELLLVVGARVEFGAQSGRVTVNRGGDFAKLRARFRPGSPLASASTNRLDARSELGERLS